jgi:hypothetical protein
VISYSHRIFIYGPVAALVLLVVGYSIYWQASAKALAAELDHANGKEVMPGITFAFAEKEIGGFPFRLDAVLSGVTFAHHSPDGETAWRSEKLALHMLSYGPNHFLFEATGLQTFDWPGASAKSNVYYVTPETARASAILRDGKLARFDLDLVDVEAQDADPKAVSGRNLSAGRAQFHLRANDDNTIDVAVKIEDTHIGPGYQPVYGSDVALLMLIGSLSRSETLDRLRGGKDSFANAAENWRVADGTLTVTGLTAQWGDAEADGKATLGFDPDHRLSGTIESLISGGKASGTAAAVSALVDTGTDAQGRTLAVLRLQNGEMRIGKTIITALTPVY